MTSTARSAMRLASSWMVIVSGTITSRMSFSFGSSARWPVSALHAAAERGERARALVVARVASVRLPRRLSLVVVFGVFGAAGAGPRPAPAPTPGRRNAALTSTSSERLRGAPLDGT